MAEFPDRDDEAQAEYVRGKVIVAMVRLENIVGFALVAFLGLDDRQRRFLDEALLSRARMIDKIRGLEMAIESDPELKAEFGSLPRELRDLNTLRNTLAHYDGVQHRTIVVTMAEGGPASVAPAPGPFDPIVFFREFDGTRHEVALADTVARLNAAAHQLWTFRDRFTSSIGTASEPNLDR
jgi:hypothetical protein